MTSEARRSASIDRHFQFVADLLKGREHDRHSLARRLGIQPAMADRLMNAAVEHVPNVVERREGKRRVVRMSTPRAVTEPTYPVAVAACFGASLWPLFEGSSYQAGIREALQQVIGRTKRGSVFKDIDRKFWFLARGGELALLDRAHLLDEVIEAVLQHHVISVEYTRFEGTTTRMRLEPLSIAVHDHQLYVIARGDDARLHPYRFSRLTDVDVLDESFPYPTRSEYDPAQVFRDSFGIFLNLPVEDVELKLARRWASFARTHRWHTSQVVDVARDHVRVKLHVRVCPELEAWIRGFGADVEVVTPVGLREKVAGATSSRPAERKGPGSAANRSPSR
jgi:predicted DNA-binding transcriptional regulator YafY